jgi:hypothetical protein
MFLFPFISILPENLCFYCVNWGNTPGESLGISNETANLSRIFFFAVKGVFF